MHSELLLCAVQLVVVFEFLHVFLCPCLSFMLKSNMKDNHVCCQAVKSHHQSVSNLSMAQLVYIMSEIIEGDSASFIFNFAMCVFIVHLYVYVVYIIVPYSKYIHVFIFETGGQAVKQLNNVGQQVLAFQRTMETKAQKVHTM